MARACCKPFRCLKWEDSRSQLASVVGKQGASFDADRLGADIPGVALLLPRALEALNSVMNSVLAVSPLLLGGDLDREGDLDRRLRNP